MQDELFGGGEGEKTRVVLVDEQVLFVELLAAELERYADLRVVATAGNDVIAADLISQHRPAVVVASAMLPDRGAFRLLKQLRLVTKAPRYVLIDERVCVAHIREGLRLGAAGYYTKCDTVTTIVTAIRQAATGKSSFCAEIAPRIVATADGFRLAPAFRYTPLETLSQRELDVLLLIAQGATVKDCAEQLNLSASTVDNHKTRFMRKLNVHRTIDLVRLAIREQLIPG